jgi:methionyl-tRNA formyltransferase
VLDRGPAQGELAAADGRFVLGCAEGALELLAVQPPGGRPMQAADYLRGRGLPQA